MDAIRLLLLPRHAVLPTDSFLHVGGLHPLGNDVGLATRGNDTSSGLLAGSNASSLPVPVS